MSKRILSLVLTLALVLGSFSMAFADTAATTSSKALTDVAGTNYEKAVTTLGKLDILNGYPDGTFKPGNTITRAEFAKVVSISRGLKAAAENSKGNTKFTDVTSAHWASGYINVAEKNGLINGVGNGKFAPESQITYEQAITMIVRALGYEQAAQTLGGYPVGHLSVASREQLLREIASTEGSQGTAASRGLVALLINNALDIPKMIQVGYGDQAKWIKSGTDGTKELYLFQDLGLVQLDKVVVTKTDSKKQQVTVGGRGLKADKDFNYVGLKGMRVTAWYNDRTDELIVCKEDGAYKAKYDVVEKTTKSDEIKLINANEKYDVAKGSGVKASDFNADNNTYAKVIINEYGEVNSVEAYNLTDEIVVKEVSKDLIKGYDRREISDSTDYTIIKNGKQISAADLKEKDLVIYDSKEEVAVVITDIRTGKLDKVYKEGFKFEGKTYDNKTDKYGNVKYISADNLENVDDNVLEEMEKNGEVKVYFSFDGKPLFIDGKAEEVASNYVMLESDTTEFNNRGDKYMTFDVLNSEGKVVKYEVKNSDIEKTGTNKLYATNKLATWITDFKAGSIAKITTDANNKLTKVEAISKTADAKNVEVDDTYVSGARLQSNTVVFMKDGEKKVKDYSVTKWVDAKKEFKKVVSGIAYIHEDKVVAIFAAETDGDTATKDVVGVIKKSKETTAKSRYDVIVEINGKEVDYVAKGTVTDIANLEKQVDKVVVLEVTKEGNELKGWSAPKAADTKVVRVKSATSGTLTDTNDNKYDVEGQYYNNSLRSTIKAGDVVGETVTLYFQPGSSKYVQVVVSGATSVVDQKNTLNTAYIKANQLYVVIDNVDYVYYGAKTLVELRTLEGKVVDVTKRGDAVTEVEAKSVVVDKNALIAAIAKGKAEPTTGKTAASVKVLTDAITAAESVRDNTSATQTQVSEAAKAITDAIVGLVNEGDLVGTIENTIYGNVLTVNIASGSAVTVVTVNSTPKVLNETYVVDGTELRVFDVNKTDTVKVTINGAEKNVTIK